MAMGCLSNFIAIGAKPLRRRIRDTVVVAPSPYAADDEDHCVVVVVADGVLISKYSWEGVEKATANFSKMIGSGGFSTVYMATHVAGVGAGAVKVNAPSDHLNRIFKQELDVLIRLRHPNIVRLLGFCDDHENGGALVLEYMPNGSLQDKLHPPVGSSSSSILPWRRRVAIALQLAQALEYMHDKSDPQIVHGDIKASNVLLDYNLDCKLCDFGSAKAGFSSAVATHGRQLRKMMLMGSPGYTDPHYLRTGMATKKNDIYSYGVILLEMVTGMEAFSQERNLSLTSILGPLIRSEAQVGPRLDDVVDPWLNKAGVDLGQIRTILSLAALCLSQSPASRPSAAQISSTISDMSPFSSFLSSPPHKDSTYLNHPPPTQS